MCGTELLRCVPGQAARPPINSGSAHLRAAQRPQPAAAQWHRWSGQRGELLPPRAHARPAAAGGTTPPASPRPATPGAPARSKERTQRHMYHHQRAHCMHTKGTWPGGGRACKQMLCLLHCQAFPCAPPGPHATAGQCSTSTQSCMAKCICRPMQHRRTKTNHMLRLPRGPASRRVPEQWPHPAHSCRKPGGPPAPLPQEGRP